MSVVFHPKKRTETLRRKTHHSNNGRGSISTSSHLSLRRASKSVVSQTSVANTRMETAEPTIVLTCEARELDFAQQLYSITIRSTSLAIRFRPRSCRKTAAYAYNSRYTRLGQQSGFQEHYMLLRCWDRAMHLAGN